MDFGFYVLDFLDLNLWFYGFWISEFWVWILDFGFSFGLKEHGRRVWIMLGKGPERPGFGLGR